MMPTEQLPVVCTVKSGLRCVLTYRVLDPNGVPVNLTGRTLLSQLRKPNKTLDLVATAVVTIADQTTRTGEFSLDFGVLDVAAGHYVFDVVEDTTSSPLVGDTGVIAVTRRISQKVTP